MMSAICDVPERPVPATKTGEGEDMEFTQVRPPPLRNEYSAG